MSWHLQSLEICFVIILASFLFVIMLNTLTFMFFFFGRNIFGDKKLPLSVYLSKLIMNE